MDKKERAIRIVKELAEHLEKRPVQIMRDDEDYYEMVVRVLKARLEREVWNGIELCYVPEINDQVKSGSTCGEFGHYPGSKMGGKWWINGKNEVDFVHNVYYDVHSE